MDMHEAAKRLDGSEYGMEGSRELWAEMKASRLVAIFGASDDLIELRGAIYDEVGAYDGGAVYITSAGLPKNECANDDCPHFKRALKNAAVIEAIWSAPGEPSWTYRTDLPHASFAVNEGGEPYCRGIVISLNDVPTI